MATHPDAEYQLKPGQIFEGKYRILRELGRGGFGMVYLAFQESMDRKVALKILRPSAVIQSTSAIERFHREVKIISKLKHPNTVTIHSFGKTHDGGLYMVLEFVEGEELKQILKREGPQESDRAVKFTLQIAKSLAEAHKHGVVHRDLKPANIMITQIGADRDFIKVLDFGVARLLDPKTNDLTSIGLPAGERELIGTPRYMSPEQVRGELLTGASDIYSLGLMLYEMLAGKPAVQGDSTMALITQQIMPKPLKLPALATFHPKLQEVVRIATSKSARERFRTADQMAEVLEDFLFVQKSDRTSGNFETFSNTPSWNPNSTPGNVAYGAPSNLQSGHFNNATPSGVNSIQDFHRGSGQFQTVQPQLVPGNQGNQPPSVYDPINFQATVERDALQRQQPSQPSQQSTGNIFSDSIELDLPPLPEDQDSFGIEERSERPRINSNKLAAVRSPPRFPMYQFYFKTIISLIMMTVFGYIGFVSMGALLGSILEGSFRFYVAILVVPILPLLGGLFEGTRVPDRVRVIEPFLAPLSRGLFSASIFCLGTAIFLGIVFANKIVPRLEHQPNWFLGDDSLVREFNTSMSKKIAMMYKTAGEAVGRYDRMEADNITGKPQSPVPTRPAKSSNTHVVIPVRKKTLPAPTRPKTKREYDKRQKTQSKDKIKLKKEKENKVEW